MFTVLIVDDEYFIREMLKGIIPWEEYGFEIIGEAANAKQAIQFLEATEPDLLFLDINLPGQDGFHVAQFIREAALKTHIVIVTGYSDFEFARKAIRNQVRDYLLKPVSEIELIQLLEDIQEELNHYSKQQLEMQNLNKRITAILENTVPDTIQQIAEDISQSTDPESNSNDMMQRIKNYVHSNINDPELNVQKIAGDLFMNVSYVSSTFKKIEGQGLHNYIYTARMKLAYKLIISTNDTLEQIVEAVGFKSTVYFSKCLKRYYGCSFRDIRKIQAKYLSQESAKKEE